MTITEFLLARIAEDEALAESAANLSNGGRWWVDPNAVNSGKHWIYDTGEKFTDREVADHITRHSPALVLAECAAKRAIVERETEKLLDDWCLRSAEHMMSFDAWCAEWQKIMAPTLSDLAAVYDDHPDYDEAWRV